MTLEQASLAKLELVCDKLALGPDDHVLEIGTGWGGFARPRRRHPRLPRHHHDALERAARARARARARGGRRGPRHRARARLPRARRPLRQARLDRDDRGRRLEGLRHLLRALLGPARAQRRDAAAGDHDRRPRLRGRARVARASSARTSSRTAACRRSRSSPAASRAAPTCASTHFEDFGLDYAETLRRWRANLERDPSGWRRSATTSASGACGGCTCATARRASPSAGSASRRRCWPSRAGRAQRQRVSSPGERAAVQRGGVLDVGRRGHAGELIGGRRGRRPATARSSCRTRARSSASTRARRGGAGPSTWPSSCAATHTLQRPRIAGAAPRPAAPPPARSTAGRSTVV